MNTLTLKDLPDNLASSGGSLLSMIMQLSMSIGVTIAGLLLGLLVRSMSASTAAPHKPSLCTPGLAWRLSSPFRRSSLPECRTIRIKMWLFHGEKERAMKFWRPGITGKLFLAIFATCIVLLITMHWAVRISFERGFIDYIKHGNEQRLQMLGDALGEQYAQHGNWRFLRNNDRFVFQILRSLEHDNNEDKPGPGMPPHGWRTQFWVVDQNNKVLVGPRAPVPPDGTRRPIMVNGAEVGAVIASLLND